MAEREMAIGFIPLLDASIPIAALEMGFAEDQGISLKLFRETSWANIRDRISIGHFDAAHMLAPMPIAANLGLTPFDTEIAAPMALGLGGNAVTVSVAVHDGLDGAPFSNALDAGHALQALIAKRRGDHPPLRFGVVHPHSAHNLELRYWLAACGIAPDKDVEIVILPPTLMADALKARTIDGYCVGEPWNTAALMAGHGRILTTKEQIWASSPEKVLGVSAAVVRDAPEAASGLVRACYMAARWCGDRANHDRLSELLSSPDYLAVDADVIKNALTGLAAYEPFAKAATFPWKSHALWFYTQMVRWGMVAHSPENATRAADTYRPDLYRGSLSALDAPIPTASSKVEGALSQEQYVGAANGKLLLGPDGFFDGRLFDPDELDSYISAQTGG